MSVAQCLGVGVASQGLSETEALANLAEALELYFEPPRAIALPGVRALDVKIDAAWRAAVSRSGTLS